MSEEEIEAIYNPETGRIACPIIQAMWGCNSFTPQSYFSALDWETAPARGQRRFKASRMQWRNLGKLSRADRIKLWEGTK